MKIVNCTQWSPVRDSGAGSCLEGHFHFRPTNNQCLRCIDRVSAFPNHPITLNYEPIARETCGGCEFRVEIDSSFAIGCSKKGAVANSPICLKSAVLYDHVKTGYCPIGKA